MWATGSQKTSFRAKNHRHSPAAPRTLHTPHSTAITPRTPRQSPSTMASKRTSGGGTTSAPPPSHFDERGVRERWPVLVYRLQSHRGWEVYSDPGQEANANAAAPSSSAGASGRKAGTGGKSARAKGGADGGGTDDGPSSRDARAAAEEELTAAPREGCIEVRRMRLRIRLFEQSAPWDPDRPGRRRGRPGRGGDRSRRAGGAGGCEGNDDDGGDGYSSDTPGADGWNDNSLLVRRRDTLLVTTRRGVGAVVLRFKSTRDCIDFCDRLTYLNREHLAPPPTREDDDEDTQRGGYVHGLDERELRADEVRHAKRRKQQCVDDGEALARRLVPRPMREAARDAPPATEEDVARDDARREEVASYIVRLAHDEAFRGFVDELERGLGAAEDTAAIQAAFGA